MIEKTLRSFCDSSYRWLIVTVGTFIVGLVLVLPLVDVYCAERTEKAALQAEVLSARQTAASLDKYEARVREKLAEVGKFEARAVSAETLPDLRTRLMDLARETGCNLRRLSVEEAMTRPWTHEDDPIEAPRQTKASTETASSFSLETWPVNISLNGSNTNLRSMLERMEADGMLMHTKRFEMHPASEGGKLLDVDMELWYFNLARSK